MTPTPTDLEKQIEDLAEWILHTPAYTQANLENKLTTLLQTICLEVIGRDAQPENEFDPHRVENRTKAIQRQRLSNLIEGKKK